MKVLGYVVVILGVFLFSGFGFIYYTEGEDAFSTKTVELQKERHIKAKEVKSILITSKSTDVKVLPHDEEDISVEFNGEVSEKMKDAFTLMVTENIGSVHIDIERTTRPSFTVFAINKGTLLTVKVPRQFFEELSIESTSGDILVSDLTSTHLTLKATSGDIDAANIFSDKINLKTTSGDIFGKELAGKLNITAEATSGDIVFETIETSFSIDFKATSGDGEVNVPGFLFEEKSEDRILGKIGSENPSIIVRTTSGDFTIQ